MLDNDKKSYFNYNNFFGAVTFAQSDTTWIKKKINLKKLRK